MVYLSSLFSCTSCIYEEVIARLRVVIEWLDRQGIVDKETLLALLQSITDSMSLDRLGAFCAQELEILSKVKEVFDLWRPRLTRRLLPLRSMLC
jgi:hypothetical protein